MCRILAYLGEPLSLDGPLFAADNSLVRQSLSPRLMSLLNIGGFGLVAWEAASREPERPYSYRTPNVPVFDRNLKALAEKVHVTSAIAHVRGLVYDAGQNVGPQNLHPFRFGEARVVLAQNGALHRFAEMRYDLLEFIRPELARSIQGTTDAEWIYAADSRASTTRSGPSPRANSRRQPRRQLSRSANCVSVMESTRTRR
jgi:glutamine amidotransferase